MIESLGSHFVFVFVFRNTVCLSFPLASSWHKKGIQACGSGTVGKARGPGQRHLCEGMVAHPSSGEVETDST